MPDHAPYKANITFSRKKKIGKSAPEKNNDGHKRNSRVGERSLLLSSVRHWLGHPPGGTPPRHPAVTHCSLVFTAAILWRSLAREPALIHTRKATNTTDGQRVRHVGTSLLYYVYVHGATVQLSGFRDVWISISVLWLLIFITGNFGNLLNYTLNILFPNAIYSTCILVFGSMLGSVFSYVDWLERYLII